MVVVEKWNWSSGIVEGVGGDMERERICLRKRGSLATVVDIVLQVVTQVV